MSTSQNPDEERRGPTLPDCGLLVTHVRLPARTGFRIEYHNPTNKEIAVLADFERSKNLSLCEEQPPGVAVEEAEDGVPRLNARVTVPPRQTVCVSLELIYVRREPNLAMELSLVDDEV